MTLWRISMVLLLAGALFPAIAPASPPEIDVKTVFRLLQNDDLPAPEAWSGIWQNDVSIFLCGSSVPFSSSSFTDTLCTGDPAFTPEDDEFEFTCSGTVNSTIVDVECIGEAQVFEGCVQSFTVDYLATLGTNSYSGVTVSNIVYEGNCGELADMCLRIETEGTRTGPQPSNCVTPVAPIRWGGLKALYE